MGFRAGYNVTTGARNSIFGVITNESTEDYEVEEY